VLTAATCLFALRGAFRGIHIAGGFALFGTGGLAAVLLPREVPAALGRGLRRLVWASLAVTLLAGGLWFLLESADMAGATDLADLSAALPVVAWSTRFGLLVIGRCAAFVAAALCFQFGWYRVAALLAGGAVAAEAWLGHGGAMAGTVGNLLLVSSIFHLLGGGAWLGALPALRLALKHLSIAAAGRLARRFSPVGIACVLCIIGSATLQFIFLIGSPRALFTSGYGLTALLKILLLLGLVLLAARNRYRLTPALAVGDEAARRMLLRSVAVEIVLGLAVLLAAGILIQLTPPTMAVMLEQQGG
jgi:putative copper export protein